MNVSFIKSQLRNNVKTDSISRFGSVNIKNHIYFMYKKINATTLSHKKTNKCNNFQIMLKAKHHSQTKQSIFDCFSSITF